jgi:hypothetical protein
MKVATESTSSQHFGHRPGSASFCRRLDWGPFHAEPLQGDRLKHTSIGSSLIITRNIIRITLLFRCSYARAAFKGGRATPGSPARRSGRSRR